MYSKAGLVQSREHEPNLGESKCVHVVLVWSNVAYHCDSRVYPAGQIKGLHHD